MTSTRERQQRAAARARLAREMEQRQAAARKRRQIRLVTGAAGAVLVVLLGTVWAVTAWTGDDEPDPAAADPAPTAAPTAESGEEPVAVSGDCEWFPDDPEVNPNLTDVGTPEVGDPPDGPATMRIETNHGPIEVEVDAERAPCTYASFVHLADQQFYDDTPCHRLTTAEIFVLQCGDPTGSGAGGPTYRYAEENLPVDAQPAYPAGTVAMAKTQQPNSTGSQFFIVYDDTELPPDYTVLGTVTEGLDVVEEVAAGGVEDGSTDGAPSTETVIETLRID